MLSKLLRHEFRATQRIMLPLYLLLLVTAGMFHLSMLMRENERIGEGWAARIFTGVSITLFVISLIGVSVLACALMIYRFYKNLMTDEGYLMFTLPVTTHQLILSKLIVSLVWSVATVLADALAVVVAMCRMVEMNDLRQAWQEFLYLLGDMTAGEIVGYGIEIALLMLFSAVASFLTFYAAIALGHSFANHKILLSVAFYFAFTIGLQIIRNLISVFSIGAVSFRWEELDPYALIHWGLGGAMGLSVLQAVGFYLLTHGMLRRRLNLQ